MSGQGGQAGYIADMFAEQAPDPSEGPGEIAGFYAGCNILITGGSGFLGMLLMEKILRSCPNVSKVYLLMRAKKGKSPEIRFKEQFKDPLYDRLKREQPGFAEKVILVEGDMAESELGLSSESRQLLRDTHIVFHVAATVRFDEKLRLATNINVRGTKQLLLCAKEMTGLKAFVHISTAYSNCVNNDIDEKFYPPPIDGDKLITLVDTLDDPILDHMTPVLVGKWPNTYAFTKAIAEDVVRRYSDGVPVAVVRPSIVTTTAEEPVAGWINNFYGAVGIVVGASTGLLRTLHCQKDNVADMVPADYVVNNIIVAGWDIANTKTMNRTTVGSIPEGDKEIDDLPIYNAVSSCQKPITWGKYMKQLEMHAQKVPTKKTLWYYCFTLNKHLWVHKIYILFLHLIPAIIVDSLLYVTGRKPMLWNAYKKIHKFSSVIEYFTMQQWRFRNDGVMRLWDKISPADRSKFNFNMENLDWNDYVYYQARGLRQYIIKDPLDTVPEASVKFSRLKIAHYTLCAAATSLLLWVFTLLLRFIGLWPSSTV